MRCASVSNLDLSTRNGRFAAIADGDDGAPVVMLLHGYPDHAPSWRPVMRRLAGAGYRAVAPWLRGYAPSVLDGPHTIDQLADDFTALADALSPDAPVRIVGHDWGAIGTYPALAAAPGRFSAAVTMSVPHPGVFRGARNLSQLRRSWYVILYQLPAIPALVTPRRDFAMIDKLWRDWSPGYTPDPDEHARLKDCLRASMPAPVLYYRSIAKMMSRRPPRVSVPTLNLHGADDGCVGASLTDGQDRWFDGPFRRDIVPGVGHFMQLEDPPAVADAIVGWFRDHD